MATQSTTGLINLAGPQRVTLQSYNERTADAGIGVAIGSALLYLEAASAAEHLYRTIARAKITDLPVHGDPKHVEPIDDVSQLAMTLRVRGVPSAAAVLVKPDGDEHAHVRLKVGDGRLIYAIRNQRAFFDVKEAFGEALRMSEDVFLPPVSLPGPRLGLSPVSLVQSVDSSAMQA